MPEQDFDPVIDRFSEMRRIINPDTAEEPWRWGNVRTVVAMLIDEVEEHNTAIYALQVSANARAEAERPRMTRQDLIGGERLPVEVTQRSAALGQLVEYPEGTPAHLAELRTALAEARRELGGLYDERYRWHQTRKESAKLREEAKHLTTAVRDLLATLDSIDDGHDVEHGIQARAAQYTIREFLATRVRGWGDEDG